MAQLEFDEGVAKQLDAMYKTRDVLRRRGLVREALGAEAGERILEVGCGPGYYVSELLDEVGSEGFVVGIDGSEAMLGVAQNRCANAPNVDFKQADATSLPFGGYPGRARRDPPRDQDELARRREFYFSITQFCFAATRPA